MKNEFSQLLLRTRMLAVLILLGSQISINHPTIALLKLYAHMHVCMRVHIISLCAILCFVYTDSSHSPGAHMPY